MNDKMKSRLDAFALVLGGVSLAGVFGALPFGALPVVTNDRINAAWDRKLRFEEPAGCSEPDPDCANAYWAT